MTHQLQEIIDCLQKVKDDFLLMDPIIEIVNGPKYDMTEHNADMVRMIDETIGYLSNRNS